MMKLTYYIFFLLIVFSCNEKKSTNKLEGQWEVIKTDIKDFSLPNGCDNLNSKDVFIFDQETFKIKDKEHCDYSYKLRGNKITFFVSDFSFDMKIKEIQGNNLILLSKHLPERMMIDFKEEFLNYKINGYKIYLTKIVNGLN
ncbi:hypothetical protein [Tenacibaculum maritimum]|uniref:hypothetical protein n=1 Tax=Tenacibaculum maritimum TaxID=107401 RepID=UPI0013302549|nr:hypothetical protein [Tenacibaculum maritimum]